MADTFNPSFPLKPVWIDDAYFFKAQPATDRADWHAVPVDQFAALAAHCDRVGPNAKGALFGYKGTRTINNQPHPRNVLCLNADRTECFADLAAVKPVEAPPAR